MDLNTFGGTKAAMVLADKLANEESWVQKKVAEFFQKFMEGLHQLEYVPDLHIRMSMANMWFQRHNEDAAESLNTEHVTYIRNVLKSHWRKWIDEQPTLEYIYARQSGNTSWRAPTPEN